MVSYVVYVFPTRMQNVDTGFLEITGFLFLSYRVETYWFSLAIWIRNLSLALVPVLPHVIIQIMAFNVLLFIMFFLVSRYSPWRVQLANYLDLAIFCAVIGVNCLAVGFAKPNTTTMATMCVVFIMLALACLLLAGLYGITKVFAPSKKTYEFFLSHHKSATGALARLLKMMILEARGKTGVFLDSDNLMSLDLLFDTVASEVECMVLISSAEVLKRPWCVGELTIAYFKKVETYPLFCTDFKQADDEFIENYINYCSDMVPLSENSITLESVQAALKWFGSLPGISLPATLFADDLDKLVSNLIAHKMQSLENIEVTKTYVAPRSNADIMVAADEDVAEAMASARVLCKLLCGCLHRVVLLRWCLLQLRYVLVDLHNVIARPHNNLQKNSKVQEKN